MMSCESSGTDKWSVGSGEPYSLADCFGSLLASGPHKFSAGSRRDICLGILPVVVVVMSDNSAGVWAEGMNDRLFADEMSRVVYPR